MPPIAALLPLIGDILDRVLPDDKSKEQAKLEMAKMALESRTIELNAIRDVDVAQAQVNAAEASTDLFRGGWRPFIGWVSGVGLAYQFVAYPMLNGYYPQLTPLDTESLMWLITGMLGLGAYRTFEKVKR
jgi:hypothetical protein